MDAKDKPLTGAQTESSANEFRVIVLTHGGAGEVINSLIRCGVSVAGVFVETDIVRHRARVEKVKRSIRYDGYLATINKLLKQIFGRKDKNRYVMDAEENRSELETFAANHRIPFYLVDNYHSVESIALMSSVNADLGVIYGTNIIKESVFNLPKRGSINLHQGLAPYYRGGPPVFWEIYNGETEVGLTVHYVAAKVDCGDIILQESVPLIYDYSFGLDYEKFISDFSEQLKKRGAQMIAEAVKAIASGTVDAKPQDPNIGKRYRLPLKAEKDELRRRLRKRHRQPANSWKPEQPEIG